MTTGTDELLSVAVGAARAAARIHAEGRRSALDVAEKDASPFNLVTHVDRAAEEAIVDRILEARPDDAILGEEGGDAAGTSGLRWLVDPLDGTVNYLFGLPQWCVSVACEERVGVILDPIREERFEAVAGVAATLGGEPLGPSSRDDLSTALVATGFAYDAGVRARQAEVVREVIPRVADIRRMGSAALDLAWTAAGRYDAFYERGVSAWDVAAGTMLCAAAGLEVRRLEPRDGLPAGVLAAPAGLVDELLALVC
jgi:myo-inositol-1(or 4)-monophosphatase